MIDTPSFGIVIVIVLIFSPLAATMVFLITYNEYIHHFTDKKRPFKEAVNAAVVAFFVFAAVSIAASLIFRRYFCQ